MIVDIPTQPVHLPLISQTERMGDLTRLYEKKIVVRPGVPILILSDHNHHFEFSLCYFTPTFGQPLSRAIRTNLEMNIVYHFHIDGRSEETVQELENILCIYLIKFGNGWDRHLPLANSPITIPTNSVPLRHRNRPSMVVSADCRSVG